MKNLKDLDTEREKKFVQEEGGPYLFTCISRMNCGKNLSALRGTTAKQKIIKKEGYSASVNAEKK